MENKKISKKRDESRFKKGGGQAVKEKNRVLKD